MSQVNYETKIQNAVKESANTDFNEPEVYIKGQLPKQIVEDHVCLRFLLVFVVSCLFFFAF